MSYCAYCERKAVRYTIADIDKGKPVFMCEKHYKQKVKK